MIMASSVQKRSVLAKAKPVEPVAHHSTCNHTHKEHWSRLLCMRGNVFCGVQLVQIIKVPDKRGLDNRGCTVSYSG